MKTQRGDRVIGEGATVARTRIRDIYTYRELLLNLVRKELKVKYKNSALGFFWSMLNPLLYLVIFSVVLGVFLRSGIPWYAFYLLTGILAWNLFNNGLTGATHVFVSNSTLVSKVYFPREILPLSAVGAGLVHFGLQLAVLLVAQAAFGYMRFWDAGLVLLPAALFVQILLVIAMGLVLSVANVYYRDIQHLLEVGLLAWFWMTPIIYASAWVQEQLASHPILWGVYLANPMTPIVFGYQRALYSQVNVATEAGPFPVLIDAPLMWYAKRLGYVGIACLVLLVAGWFLFRRMERRLVEEL